MPFFDLELDALVDYRPSHDDPADFDQFWTRELDEARAHDGAVEIQPVANDLAVLRTYDVTFPGYGGEPIKAWLHLPFGDERPRACVVEFVGYGGGRGLPHEKTMWAVAGYAHLVVDTRGQGSTWMSGDTADPQPPASAGPQHPGFMTRGIHDPRSYYYVRLIVDAVRAVETARVLPGVDPSEIIVAGSSQGGGVALAVTALDGGIRGALIDVPFLCHIRRGTEISGQDPYAEIARYLSVHRGQAEAVFRATAYVDGMSFAPRARAPAFFSVALMDEICPPSTVFAAYNRYRGPKEIATYPYNSHEGGGAFHAARQFSWLRTLLGAAPPSDRLGHTRPSGLHTLEKRKPPG